MPKILNLDDLQQEQRVLTIRGVTYPMRDLSVEEFIDMIRKAEAAQKKRKENGEAMNLADQMESLIESVQVSFPTVPSEVLRRLTLPQLNAIIEFARDEDPEETDEEGKK